MQSKRTHENGLQNGDRSYDNCSDFADKVQRNSEELPVKVFEARDSILTTLVASDKHARAFYYMYLTIILTLGINTVVCEILYKEQFNFGINLILGGFVNIHRFFIIWICMFLNSLLPYFGFKYWASVHIWMKSKNNAKVKQWNVFWLVTFLLHCFCVLYFSTRAALSWDLGMALKPAVIMETIRFLMKNYAFVRSNVPNILQYKRDKPVQNFCPNISHYLYFSFAPVLVYRDNYPRSQQKIRWDFVASSLLNFIAGILFYSFILERGYIYYLSDYGLKEYTWKDIVMIVLQTVPYGFLALANLCYTGIHSWFNAFAEMLHFSDRLFYKDWWTSTSDMRFMRTWNVVVHDWLYLYVYGDLYKFVVHDRFVAKMLALFLIAATHDYILSFSLGFCIPIFCYQYSGFLLIMKLKFKNDAIGGVFMLYTLSFMINIVVVVYVMEYFARLNCPVHEIGVYTYFKPRFLTCGN